MKQKTSSEELEDHIHEIKKLKEEFILPSKLGKRTNSTQSSN